MLKLVAAVVALLSVLSGPAQAGKSFVWEHVDTSVQVRADGTLGVAEELRLRYAGGPYTFAFRDLPNRRLDGIANVRLADPEGSYQQTDDAKSTTPRTYSISREDGVQRVRWVYPATSDATRTFTLTYDVAGAVRRYADHDEVWWSMVFPTRDEVVEQASGVIVLPLQVAPNALVATTPDVVPSGGVDLQPGAVRFQAANVAPDKEITLKVDFPKRIVGGAAPNWQADQDAADLYNLTTRPTVNVALSALSALLVLALGGWAWRWQQQHRDPQPTFSGMVYAPPADLRPGAAARLIGQDDTRIFLATLFDLANRGYLTLKETPSGGRGTHHIPTAVRTAASAGDLAPYEQQLLDALFGGTHEAVLNKPDSAITRAMPAIGRLVEQQLVEHGLLDQAAQTQRKRALRLSGLLFAVGLALLVAGMLLAKRYSFWLPTVGAAVVIGSIAWYIVAARMQGLTSAGAEARARWNGFQAYLEQIGSADVRPGGFGELLPYAAGIGDARKLTHRYATTHEVLPIWYYPVIFSNSDMAPMAPGSDMNSSLLLQDFSQNFLSTISSAESSASSAGGGGGGGGGGSGGGGGGAG